MAECLSWAPSCTSRRRGGGSFLVFGLPIAFESSRRRCRGSSWSSAPAGFGKTTLIDAVAGVDVGPRPRVAWLSLDAEDCDLRRFLTHLVAALQTTSPAGGRARRWRCWTATGLFRPRPCWSAWSTTSTSSAGRPCWRSTTTTSSTRRTSTRPSRSCSTTCRLRSPSPSRRARTRRCRCLGCAAAASSSSCAPPTCGSPPTRPTRSSTDVMGLDLEPAHVAALESRTEGWAAGLQLAALSARGRADAGDSGGGGLRRRVHRQPPVRPGLPARGGAATASPTTSAGSSSTPRCSSS